MYLPWSWFPLQNWVLISTYTMFFSHMDAVFLDVCRCYPISARDMPSPWHVTILVFIMDKCFILHDQLDEASRCMCWNIQTILELGEWEKKRAITTSFVKLTTRLTGRLTEMLILSLVAAYRQNSAISSMTINSADKFMVKTACCFSYCPNFICNHFNNVNGD